LKNFKQRECGWPSGDDKVLLLLNAEKRVLIVEALLVNLRKLGGKGKDLCEQLGPHLQEDNSIHLLELIKALLQHAYAENWAYQVIIAFVAPLDLQLSNLVWKDNNGAGTAMELIMAKGF